jgi:hypothetical protein
MVLVKQSNSPLKHLTYEIAFETILEKMLDKVSFLDAVREDHRNINPGQMMQWILSHPERKSRYYEAQQTRAELISEELLAIADGKDDLEDIDRQKLRINERRKQMAVWDRKRFGEVKQVDITSSVSISAAIAEADRRLQTLEPLKLDNVTDVI